MHIHHHSVSTTLRQALFCGSAMALLAWAPSSFAQGTDEREAPSYRTGPAEIIVTARKRDETAIDVPAAITALGSEALEKYGSRDFWGLQNQVPGLFIQDIPSTSGGAVALRGLSSSPNNPTQDQTVAINIDGVQVGSGTIIRLGQIDVQQIEVLKGPQALFFGKNSPAGVMSIRSKDPGDRFEVDGSLGYEFNAREIYGQVGAGGPITDTLGARVVVAGNQMKGWIKNKAETIPGFGFGPSSDRSPDKKEVFARGTLVWDPTPEFKARAKYSYGKMTSDSDIFDRQQRIFCPFNMPQDKGYGGFIDCKADDITTNGLQDPRLTPFIQAIIDLPGNEYMDDFPDDPGQRTVMHLGSLELNYDIAPDIIVTSITGLFKLEDQFNGAAMYGTGGGLSADNTLTRKEFSQEIRLVTDMDSIVNFAVGAYYQDTRIKNANSLAVDLFAVGFAPAPGLACSCSTSDYITRGKAKSIFGQVIVKPTEQFEIAAGARYSEETKTLVRGALNGIPKTNYNPGRVKFTDTSPEVTVRYRPNQNWTVFGAWRNGFKSGGFNTGTGSAGAGVTDISYAPEEIDGFEAGLKYANGRFRANLTAYTYTYKDLQVATFDPNTLSQRLINAAAAKIRGIEGDFNWRTPVDGLELRGSFNYNKARYSEFIAGCYAGQGAPQGCVIRQNDAGADFLGQDLDGAPLVLAPDWTGSLGFTYERPVGSTMMFGITSDALYSGSFFGQLEDAPQVKQRQYVNLDASVYVGAEDGRWKLALIGRNLTEVYRARFVSQTPLTGVAPSINLAFPGGVNPGMLPDFSGNLNRGREIRMQFSFRY